MPIHLTDQSRRDFLVSVSSGLVVLPGLAAHAAEVDEDVIALLNDTHIGEEQKPDAAHPRNLKVAVDYLLGLKRRPGAVFVNGDLAVNDGQPGDYRFFAKLIEPLRAAGMPVHLTLGNRDDRDVFYRVLAEERPARQLVASRHVGVVTTRRANVFLLDSLKKTRAAPGDLGEEQLTWLAQALDAHADKPALVLAHHNPRLGGDRKRQRLGLEDTEALWKVLAGRPHVKAYVHGHLHDWGLSRHADIHIVNTPATSFVLDPKVSTTGWTMARLRDDGMSLTTLTHQANHAWNDRVHELKWRS